MQNSYPSLTRAIIYAGVALFSFFAASDYGPRPPAWVRFVPMTVFYHPCVSGTRAVLRAIGGAHWKPLNCTEPLSADAHAQYWHADDRDLADAQWERVRSKSDVTNGYYSDGFIEG